MLEKAPEERLFTVLDEKTGADAFVLPFYRQTMDGAQPPPVVDRDGMLVAPLHFIYAGWGRIDLARQRYVDLLIDANDDFRGSLGRGNPDERMNLSAAASRIATRTPMTAEVMRPLGMAGSFHRTERPAHVFNPRPVRLCTGQMRTDRRDDAHVEGGSCCCGHRYGHDDMRVRPARRGNRADEATAHRHHGHRRRPG